MSNYLLSVTISGCGYVANPQNFMAGGIYDIQLSSSGNSVFLASRDRGVYQCGFDRAAGLL